MAHDYIRKACPGCEHVKDLDFDRGQVVLGD